MSVQDFKKCPNCLEVWSTQEKFVDDGLLEIIGYKANFEKLEEGLFFFTHKKQDCFSTMAIEVKEFLNLYTGPIYPERKAESEECPRYCLDKYQLDRCTALCDCAFVREIVQILKIKKGR